MDSVAAKITAILVAGCGSLIFGLLPACFTSSQRTRWSLVLSCLLCMGAGVLLATSLVHMLPELRASMTVMYRQYAEAIFCLGFFLLYVVDEVVHFVYGGDDAREPFEVSETEPLMRSSGANATNSEDKRSKTAPIGNIGLLVALLIHATLEGLAVGLQRSASQVLVLLAAISVHKFVIAFCLGIELRASYSSLRKHVTYIGIFVGGSVGGIALGMLVTEVPREVSEIAFPVLQGLAAGTLLYVTVSEVLPRERSRWHADSTTRMAGILQFISMLCGFIVMTDIIFWFAH